MLEVGAPARALTRAPEALGVTCLEGGFALPGEEAARLEPSGMADGGSGLAAIHEPASHIARRMYLRASLIRLKAGPALFGEDAPSARVPYYGGKPMVFDALKKRCCPTDTPSSETTRAEACCPTEESPHTRVRQQNRGDHPRLEDLIPIAVVIAAGCEGCAERMVRRAVEAGSAARDVLRTIAIVGDLREQECFRKVIAPDVMERMEGPLARARKTLDELAGTGAVAGAP